MLERLKNFLAHLRRLFEPPQEHDAVAALLADFYEGRERLAHELAGAVNLLVAAALHAGGSLTIPRDFVEMGRDPANGFSVRQTPQGDAVVECVPAEGDPP